MSFSKPSMNSEVPTRTTTQQSVLMPRINSPFQAHNLQQAQQTALAGHLAADGIETKIQHRLLMPAHPAYKPNVRGHYPNALAVSQSILSIPIHEKLTADQRCHVADSILAFVAKTGQ